MYILSTRLHKPKASKRYIQRHSVIEYLNKQTDIHLILVVAGAGYGKSITVSQWIDHRCCKYAWISIESDCNELRIFLSYLLRAVQLVYPEKLKIFASMLEASVLPEHTLLASEFINEMAECNEEFNIVLDDYHLIKNQQVHDFLNDVIKLPLAQLKFIILSRIDPALKLNKLKAYNHCIEIRMSNLKFSTSEIISIAKSTYDLTIDNDLANKLYTNTEGWVIGITLLLKELSENKTLKVPEISSLGKRQSLINFLLEEILLDQYPELRKLIIISSLFNRFSLELIQEIIDSHINNPEYNLIEDFKHFINRSMFIFPLDEENELFRFHHLIQEIFQGLAKKNYKTNEIFSFYKLGSRYFESLGHIRESIEYAQKGKDFEGAVSILERHRYYLQDRDQAIELETLLNILPTRLIENNPSLLLARAFVFESLSKFEEEQKDLDLFLKLESSEPMSLSDVSAKLWGEYYQMQSVLFFYFGKFKESLQYSLKALELIENEMFYVRDYSVSINTINYQVLKDKQKALDVFNQFVEKTPISESRCIARLHAYHCALRNWNGDLKAVLKSSSIAIELSKKEQLWNVLIIGAYNVSGAYYLSNDPKRSIAAANEIENQLYSGRPFFVIHTFAHKIFSLSALGKFEDAMHSLNTLKEFSKAFKISEVSELVLDIEIELALMKNDLKQAEELHINATYTPHPFIYSYYYPQLTNIKMLISEGRFRNMDEANSTLIEYIKHGEETENADLLIQVYALYAIWHIRMDQTENAIEYLLKSLKKTKNENYIRPYLDLGHEMKDLLKQLPTKFQHKYKSVQYIELAFEQELKLKSSTLATQGSMNIHNLANKEIAILELIAEGYQNKEIAAQLNFSINTIKKYIYILYEKLSVKNRAEAVSWWHEVNNSNKKTSPGR